MNRDTRTFIWGLILLYWSVTGFPAVLEVIIKNPKEWFLWVLALFQICVGAAGVNKIGKTVN